MSKYYGNLTADGAIEITFNTFNSSGASVTVTDLAVGDIHIHKDGGTTQRTSTAGITLSIDFDGIIGNHLIAIDTSDNTDAGFYAAGSNYEVRLEGITVDTQTLNPFIASFSIENRFMRGTDDAAPATGVNVIQISGDSDSADNLKDTYNGTGYSNGVAPSTQDQVSGIGAVGGSLTQLSESFVLTTGTVISGTFTDTFAEDQVYHQIEDAAGVADLYYEFDVGATGVASNVSITGRLNSGNDNMTMYAWNWGTTTWDVIRSYDGQNSTVDITRSAVLPANKTGTGGDLGKVRVRFEGTGLTSADLFVDQIFVSFSVVQSVVGYEGGKIWIDTIDGAAGAVVNVNGTADNPVDNLADALSLAISAGLRSFNVAQGSSITFTGGISDKAFEGLDWDLALGSQQIDNSTVTGAVITGTATGNGGSILFERCKFGTCTLPECSIVGSAIVGPITANEGSSTYFFDRCASAIAGQVAPVFDFGAAVGDIALNVRHYSGGLEVQNMGQTGTDTMSLEGHGQLIINANCSGGSATVRGHFMITDNSGSVTMEVEANFFDTKGQISAIDTVVDRIAAIQEADKVFVPASGTLTHNIKGTSTGLLKKNLKDPAGAAVNSTEDIIAAEVDTTP